MINYISSLFSDPRAALIIILLAFPGRILAISAHGYAQAWVADRCGDKTPREMGRLTLSPFAHLDVAGTILMLLVGIGWAKPLPIDPRNFRNTRKDSFKVAIAGIIMNLLFFFLGYMLCTVLIILLFGLKGMPGSILIKFAANVSPEFIAEKSGRLVSYIYQMLQYFTVCNIALTLFNLLPIPPLDGYIALSTAIGRPLYRNATGMRIASGVLFFLLLSGLLGRGLGTVIGGIMNAVGSMNGYLFSLLGLV